MKTTLKQTNIAINPTEQKHIDRHVAGISRRVSKYGAALILNIEVGRTTRHHRKGEVYRAECMLQLPKKTLRAEAEAEDIVKAFEMCRKGLEREIDTYKASKEEKDYRQARKLKKLNQMTPLAWRGEGREEAQKDELDETY